MDRWTNPPPANSFDAVEDEFLRLARNERWALICRLAGEDEIAEELTAHPINLTETRHVANCA